jgi:hypothetical protein
MAAPLSVTVFARAKTRASRGLPLPLVTDLLVPQILLGCVRPPYVTRSSGATFSQGVWARDVRATDLVFGMDLAGFTLNNNDRCCLFQYL